MGKKNKSSLGRALIKDRFGGSRGRRGNGSMLHSVELDDGYDWGRLNLQSVTEQSSFQEFLSTAETVSEEFQAEKLNITFVNPFTNTKQLSKEERQAIEKSHKENECRLQIPRRPPWNESTTPEELEKLENDSFLEWRRKLAVLQESEGLILTPYEKNIEFWRQLWRVVERSDIVVQIVDARNPLLFRCPDLETYAKEISEHKCNLILLNKSDFLTDEQRKIWADYFSEQGVKAAFFCATLEEDEKSEVLGSSPRDEESENQNKESNCPGKTENVEEIHDKICSARESEEEKVSSCKSSARESEEGEVSSCESGTAASPNPLSCSTYELKNVSSSISDIDTNLVEDGNCHNNEGGKNIFNGVRNSPKLLNRGELISFLKTVHCGPKVTPNVTTIGMVGYPNVGKSSTINSLIAEKKVSVSSTPGKTKHFQTLFLDEDLMLCDCPGLVMPSFAVTKEEMVLNGILSIDRLRDHAEPISLLASFIPRYVLEDTYGIMIPPPPEGEDPQRPPTPQELLNAYGYNKGYMSHKGIPDNPRSARYILKDFVTGKLLYCSAPPGIDQSSFHTFPPRRRLKPAIVTPQCEKVMRPNVVTAADLDKVFFEKAKIGVHSKGRQLVRTGESASEEQNVSGKPWRMIKKSNKREKLRKVYGHLDA